nr:IS1595 family transposase [uncultured Fluviicola sp.]
MSKSTKNYTIQQFSQDYPDDNTCLDKIFTIRFGQLSHCPKCSEASRFVRLKNRKCYQCSECLHQIYPCAGTVFEKTTTPLTTWFYVIYLFTVSKNGVSAYEVQRLTGVTYKTAWRMLKQVRILISTGFNMTKMNGTIELDETFVGGKNINRHKDKKVAKSQGRSFKDKTPVLGMLDRDTKQVRCFVVPDTKANTIQPIIRQFIEKGSVLMTDEWIAYKGLNADYDHNFVDHSKKIYSVGDVSSNGIENFWSVFKRTIKGSYIHVSKKYLQSYANETSFKFNNKNSDVPIFYLVLDLLPLQAS